MVRRVIAAAGLAIVATACGTPSLSANEALDHVRASMARAGVTATRVRLDGSAPAGTYRAIATVQSSRVTLTIDKDSGAFRRIEETDDTLSTRQLHTLAQQRVSNGQLRVRQFLVALAVLVAAAAVVLGLARRARLREEQAASSQGKPLGADADRIVR